MSSRSHNLYESNVHPILVLGIIMLPRTYPLVVQLYEPPRS